VWVICGRTDASIGVQHVGVADTIGVGTPLKFSAIDATLRHYALDDVSGHFHDTYGQAPQRLAGCVAVVWQFDTSVAGLVAALMPKEPPVTWRLKTWCTCTAWALTPGLTWTSWLMR
jgi:hypothetical protein